MIKRNVLFLSAVFIFGIASNTHNEDWIRNFKEGLKYGLLLKPTSRWWPKQWVHCPNLLFNRQVRGVAISQGKLYEILDDIKDVKKNSLLARWIGFSTSLTLQAGAVYGLWIGGNLLYKKYTSN